VNAPGTYLVSYYATDASGNRAIQSSPTRRSSDLVKPVITLTGAASLTLQCHVDSYSESGATVSDACDTALVAATVGGQAVNVNRSGAYTAAHNSRGDIVYGPKQVTRTVTVVDTIK